MGREYELKYRATPQQLEALRAAYPQAKAISMETVYYDVPTGELGRRRWTLRRRMENGAPVCTVKILLPDGSRGEWEVVCPEIREAIVPLIAAGAPRELAELTAGGVVETCGARFLRQAAAVCLPEGEVEVALDQGVLLGGGKTLPLNEVEVELKAGRDEVAAVYAAQLAAAYSLVPEHKSKLRRAMELTE